MHLIKIMQIYYLLKELDICPTQFIWYLNGEYSQQSVHYLILHKFICKTLPTSVTSLQCIPPPSIVSRFSQPVVMCFCICSSESISQAVWAPTKDSLNQKNPQHLEFWIFKRKVPHVDLLGFLV